MIVEYTNEEAQLVATLLNQHKQQNQTIADRASSALDKIVEAASKKEAESNTIGESDAETQTENKIRSAT